MTPDIEVTGPLPEPATAAVLDLVSAARVTDSVSPLSEHALLHVRYGGDPQARDLLLRSGGALAGYAHLDRTGPAGDPSGELVIHPAHRRQGLGLALARAALAEAAPRPLRLWAHGDLPAARALAGRAGFERARALWTMRRSLDAALDPPRFPDGVTLRTFRPGQDEQAWLELNHAAFASHPEQGAWTLADLTVREREPWFDPAGFFLAERSGQLAGFHWTKIHEARPGSSPPASQATGEVYVVGVDPGERGSGLGRALTLEGLRYLRSRRLAGVMLYVDEANTAAIRLYESLGFAHWHTDVMYRHP
ncbi:MAG TPA: mycothiol synthase [Streptosporangiaceae bacterium]|nr:mycothiol synthase [Streptosporangiaceae bacterium]